MSNPFIIEIMIIPHETFPNAYRVGRLNPETQEFFGIPGDLGLLQVQLTVCPLLNDVKTIDMLTTELTRTVAKAVGEQLNGPDLQGVQIKVAVPGKVTSYEPGDSVLEPFFKESILRVLTDGFKLGELATFAGYVSPEMRGKSNFTLNMLMRLRAEGKLTEEEFISKVEELAGPLHDMEMTMSVEDINRVLSQAKGDDKNVE